MIKSENILVVDRLRVIGEQTKEVVYEKIRPIIRFAHQYNDPKLFQNIVYRALDTINQKNILSETEDSQYLSFDLNIKDVHYVIIMCSDYVPKKTKNKIIQEIPSRGIEQTINDIITNMK